MESVPAVKEKAEPSHKMASAYFKLSAVKSTIRQRELAKFVRKITFWTVGPTLKILSALQIHQTAAKQEATSSALNAMIPIFSMRVIAWKKFRSAPITLLIVAINAQGVTITTMMVPDVHKTPRTAKKLMKMGGAKYAGALICCSTIIVCGPSTTAGITKCQATSASLALESIDHRKLGCSVY